MTVQSTSDGPERNWEKEAVVYLNVPTENHTTYFNRHHPCFDRQSHWRHPDAFLLAPTRSEITPPPLTSRLFGKCWSAEKCQVDVFSVIRRKMVKTHAEKVSKASPNAEHKRNFNTKSTTFRQLCRKQWKAERPVLESGDQQTLCASALQYTGRMEAVKVDSSLASMQDAHAWRTSRFRH